jgi:hypothetical protein
VCLWLELSDIRLHNESLTAYVARGQALKNSLEAAGETVQDCELIKVLLMRHPDEHGVVRIILTNMDNTSMTLRSRMQAANDGSKFAAV